jgi:hypothetical protein
MKYCTTEIYSTVRAMSDDGYEASGWLEDEGSETDPEKETMVLNPVNVRERIDSALETLR